VVTIAQESVRMTEGSSVELGVSALDSEGNAVAPGAILWSSSDETTALVTPEGTLRGIAPGTAVVRAGLGLSSDSVLVVVEFRDLTLGLAARVQGLGGSRLETRGSGTVSRNILANGSPGLVRTTLNTQLGPEPEGTTGAPGFLAGDTLIHVFVQGEPTLGRRTFSGPVASLGPNSELLLQGGLEGALLWYQDPDIPRRSHLFVPVEDVVLDVTSVELPTFSGFDGDGRVAGTYAFEAAGLVIEHGGVGSPPIVVGQTADTTVQVFVQFDMPLLRWDQGLANLFSNDLGFPIDSLVTGARSAMVGGQFQMGIAGGFGTGSDEANLVDLFVQLNGAGSGTFELEDLGPIDIDDPAGLPTVSFARLARGVAVNFLPPELTSEAFATSGFVTVDEFRSPTLERFGHARGALELEFAVYDNGVATGETLSIRADFYAALPPLLISSPLGPRTLFDPTGRAIVAQGS